jgi:hypothetical protein
MTLNRSELPKVGIDNLRTLLRFVLSLISLIKDGNGKKDNLFNRIIAALGLISQVREIAANIQISKAELLDLDDAESAELAQIVAASVGVRSELAEEIAIHALGLISNIFNLIDAIQDARKTT